MYTLPDLLKTEKKKQRKRNPHPNYYALRKSYMKVCLGN